MKLNRILPAIVLIVSTTAALAQNITITSITPAPYVANVLPDANISVTFSQNIINATVQPGNIVVRGSHTGVLAGTLSGGGTNTITFNPTNNFKPGEVISITITKQVLGQSTSQGLVRGHTYSFTAITGPAEATPVAFGQRNITYNNSLAPMDIKAIDIENDGDMDLLFGDAVPFGDVLNAGFNDGTGKFCITAIGETRIAEMNDFDGDGDKDMVSLTSGNGMAWTRNDGGGVFTEVIFPGGSFPHLESVRSGDIDSDGDVDIAVQNGGGIGLVWHENSGTATFTTHSVMAGNSGSYSYTQIADVNGDGAMDIVAYWRNSTKLAWYENNGTLVFTEHIMSTTMSDYLEITTADLDDDGDLDILTSNENNGVKIRWFVNDGIENFTEQILTTLTTANDGKLRVVDIDGDLDRDVLAGGQWLENNGSEVFTPHKLGSDLQQSEGIDYADMDSDGDLDLVTGGGSLTNQMLWLENTKLMTVTSVSPLNGSHSATANTDITITFSQPIDATTVTSNSVVVKSRFRGVLPGVLSVSGNTITFNATNDFLPGEDISVAITHDVRTPSRHSIERNYGFDFLVKTSVVTSAPTFGNLPPPIFTYSTTPIGLDIADMDNDGDLDIVSSSATELRWHRNDGTGSFTAVVLPLTGTNGAFALTDFNRDGRMDIATRKTTDFNGVIYLNDATQSFSTTVIQPMVLQTSGFRDIDRDGFDDILSSRYNHWNCNEYSEVARVGGTSTAINWAAGDLDNDGDIDLLKGQSQGEFHRNDGANGFSNLNLGGGVCVARADLDGDGDLDPFWAGTSSGSFMYTNDLNTPSANFGATKSIPSFSQSRSIAAGDFDGDGDLDLAGAGSTFGLTIIRNRLNEATANFTLSQTMILAANNPNLLRAGDMNGDGKIDLVAASTVDMRVSWFPNVGTAVGAPTITGFNTNNRPEGYQVIINGTNFSPVLANNVVRFNGTLATITNATATQITTRVPVGALTGVVTVTVGSNTATSPSAFNVVPNILDFTPNSGPVGTVVTLTGTTFGPTIADNQVYFDGTEAVITSATTTTIVTTVPPGATTGYIEVHTESGIASTDDSDFVVTGGGSGSALEIDLQPVSLEVCVGAVATFSVAAVANTDVFYEWYYSSTAGGPYSAIGDSFGFEGTNTDVLSVFTTDIGDPLFFRCEIYDDDGGHVTSDEASLTFTDLCAPPVITPQPLSTSIGGTISIYLVPLISTGNLNISSLQVATPPPSGAVATIDVEGYLSIDYTGVPFSGNETIEISACDFNGMCSVETFNIEVIGDVEVYNAVSPEGKNPILRFRFIEVLPETQNNKVVIYNRWGDVVFEVDNYNNTTNVFAGLSSNGVKLPSGTYYYKVTFESRPAMTGFLELKY